MHREFPAIAFLAALLLLVPLPWHWRAGNVATLSMITWLFVTNIIYGVDAIVWGDNVNIVIPVWCDITSKIIIGANFALPAACLCVCIHLEQVASVRQARTTQSDKRRRQIFELLMCFGLPILFMGLHYIVQGHRFDIIEGYGCRPTTYVSIPAILLIYVPPLLLAVLSLVFAGLALAHFMRRRITFARHLENSRSGITTSRYLRLMLMASVEMVWSIILTAYTMWFSSLDFRPYTSWAFVHSNFSRIDLYAMAFLPEIVVTNYYVLWWTVPASSFIFVAFFAFGQDAVREYMTCIVWFRRNVLRQSVREKSAGSFGSLPVVKSANDGAVSISTPPPPYPRPTPPSPYKTKGTLDDYDYEMSEADRTSIGAPSLSYQGPKAIGSVDDFEPPSPSTMPPSPSRASHHVVSLDVHDAVPSHPEKDPSDLV